MKRKQRQNKDNMAETIEQWYTLLNDTCDKYTDLLEKLDDKWTNAIRSAEYCSEEGAFNVIQNPDGTKTEKYIGDEYRKAKEQLLSTQKPFKYYLDCKKARDLECEKVRDLECEKARSLEQKNLDFSSEMESTLVETVNTDFRIKELHDLFNKPPADFPLDSNSSDGVCYDRARVLKRAPCGSGHAGKSFPLVILMEGLEKNDIEYIGNIDNAKQGYLIHQLLTTDEYNSIMEDLKIKWVAKSKELFAEYMKTVPLN